MSESGLRQRGLGLNVHLHVTREHALRRSVAAWHAVPSGSDCVHQVGLPCGHIAVIKGRDRQRANIFRRHFGQRQALHATAVIDRRERTQRRGKRRSLRNITGNFKCLGQIRTRNTPQRQRIIQNEAPPKAAIQLATVVEESDMQEYP